MKTALVLALLSTLAWAADPSINFERWRQLGPQTVYRGRTLIFAVTPEYSVTFTCYQAGSGAGLDDTCYSPSWTPNDSATDTTTQLVVDDVGLTAGGFQTQMYAGNVPIYKAANVGTNGNSPGHFNLQMWGNADAPSGTVALQEKDYIFSAGTPAGSASPCPAGTYPYPGGTPHRLTDQATPPVTRQFGLTFPGFGSTWPAWYQITIDASGNITNPLMIDGGGNYTSTPTTGEISCPDPAHPGDLRYSISVTGIPFTGVTRRQFIPITATGSATMFIRACSPCVSQPYPYLQDIHGTGWPAGTHMTYWNTNSGGQAIYLYNSAQASGPVPPDTCSGYGTTGNGCSMIWRLIPTANGSGFVEVSIPANAPLGNYPNAGWTFCADALGTTGCVSMTHNITVADVPVYTLAPPTNPKPLPALFSSQSAVPCLNVPFPLQIPYLTTANLATDCRFFSLLTLAAENGYPHWWPNILSTPPNTPDNSLELFGTLRPPTAGARVVCWSPTCSQAADPSANWFYSWGRSETILANWTGNSSWLNPARAIISRYIQSGPGAPGGWAPNPVAANADIDGSMRPYYTAGTYNLVFGYSLGGSRAMADHLPYFNNGIYTDKLIPDRAWSAQLAAGIYGISGYFDTVGFSAGSYTPSLIPGLTNLGTLNAPVLGLFYTANNGIRVPAFQFGNKLEVIRTLGRNIRNPDGSLTQEGLWYNLARELTWTQLLMLNNPAISGPYDTGPSGDQFWMVGGLALVQVIHDYEFSHEQLDLYVLKQTLDRLYAVYNTSGGNAVGAGFYPQTIVNEGAFCSGGAGTAPNTGWYAIKVVNVACANDPVATQANGSVNYSPLQGFISGPFAWWWARYAGSDNTYGDFADLQAQNAIAGDIVNGLYRYLAKSMGEEIGFAGFMYYTERQRRQNSPR